MTEEYIVNSIIRYENQIDSITNEILAKMKIEEDATRLSGDDGPGRLDNTYELLITMLPQDDDIGGGGGGGGGSSGTTSTSTTYTHGNWVTTGQVQPLLPVEWNQRFPFNHLVKNKNGSTDAPAGCVAVALAQLMTYWQHPASIYNYKFDWPLLRSFTARPDKYPTSVSGVRKYNTDADQYKKSLTDEKNFVSQVSNLINIIGMGTYMDYSNEGSQASSDDAMIFLSEYGYNAGPLVGYNYNAIIKSLNNKRPVYASGKSKKTQHKIMLIIEIGTWSEYSEGHAWIIDGYLNQRRTTNVQVTVRNKQTGAIVQQTNTTTYSYANYLHHNWGADDGVYTCLNGYFAAGSYDAYDKRFESDTRATVTYDEANFQFQKLISPEIRPR